ncbi:MAG: hypothetical protein FJ403_16745 [Verrucomicrobia bacterium]|nr:hypothetical protein [Verrucomicrobiota bacterium]
MQFLKKHYEKVILSIVLLGLAVAAGALPLQVASMRRFLDETITDRSRTKRKEFTSLDLSTNLAVVQRFHQPVELNLAGPHNAFNPVVWKKRGDGFLVRAADLGAGALEVTKIDELHMTVSFDVVTRENAEPQYTVAIARETGSQVRKDSRMVSAKQNRNDLFTVVRVEGPPEAPAALVMQLKDESEPFRITREEPFVRTIGYVADLRYPPENQLIPRKRVKDTVRLAKDNETYNIVVIDQNQVVLSAKSTQKRTTIKLNAAAPPAK